MIAKTRRGTKSRSLLVGQDLLGSAELASAVETDLPSIISTS